MCRTMLMFLEGDHSQLVESFFVSTLLFRITLCFNIISNFNVIVGLFFVVGVLHVR